MQVQLFEDFRSTFRREISNITFVIRTLGARKFFEEIPLNVIYSCHEKNLCVWFKLLSTSFIE